MVGQVGEGELGLVGGLLAPHAAEPVPARSHGRAVQLAEQFLHGVLDLLAARRQHWQGGPFRLRFHRPDNTLVDQSQPFADACRVGHQERGAERSAAGTGTGRRVARLRCHRDLGLHQQRGEEQLCRVEVRLEPDHRAQGIAGVVDGPAAAVLSHDVQQVGLGVHVRVVDGDAPGVWQLVV